MGIAFPTNHCTWIHGRSIRFWLQKCWNLLKFASFGEVYGRIHFWLDWWLFATTQNESNTHKKVVLYFMWEINQWTVVVVQLFIFIIFIEILAHIVPGLLLFMIPFVKDSGIVVAILVLSLGFNGSAVLTNLQVSMYFIIPKTILHSEWFTNFHI